MQKTCKTCGTQFNDFGSGLLNCPNCTKVQTSRPDFGGQAGMIASQPIVTEQVRLDIQGDILFGKIKTMANGREKMN